MEKIQVETSRILNQTFTFGSDALAAITATRRDKFNSRTGAAI